MYRGKDFSKCIWGWGLHNSAYNTHAHHWGQAGIRTCPWWLWLQVPHLHHSCCWNTQPFAIWGSQDKRMPANQVKAWNGISDSLFQLPVATRRWQSWVNFDQNMFQWSLLARPRNICLKAFGARDKSGVEYIEVKVVRPVWGRGGTKRGRLTMQTGTWDLGM